MKTEKYEGISLKPTKAQDYYIVGQSQSSAYAGSPGSSTSGISTLDDAIERLCEGGYVFDKRHLSYDVACCCISGPMDKVDLPPMTVSPCFEKHRTFATFDEFFSYLETDEGKCMSMTFISMDLFGEWWRRKGAKVGRKIKGKIEWKPAYSGPLFEKGTHNEG
jgi:hypothetical protein